MSSLVKQNLYIIEYYHPLINKWGVYERLTVDKRQSALLAYREAQTKRPKLSWRLKYGLTVIKTSKTKNPTTAQLNKCKQMIIDEKSKYVEPTIDWHRNPEIGGRYVTSAVHENAIKHILIWMQGTVTEKKKALPNLVKYIETVSGVNSSRARTFIYAVAREYAARQKNGGGGQMSTAIAQMIYKEAKKLEDENWHFYMIKAHIRKKYQHSKEADWAVNKLAKESAKNPIRNNANLKNPDGIIAQIRIREVEVKRLKAKLSALKNKAAYEGRAVSGLASLQREIEIKQKEIDQLTREWFRNPNAKKNFSDTDFKAFTNKRLSDLSKMFQGAVSGENKRVMISDYAPKETYRLGHLVGMKVKANGKTIDINFDGEAFLSGDLRNNLWCSGKDARIGNVRNGLPRKGALKLLGELTQIDYVTAKKHIENGELVRFWHKLGEATGEKPKLFVDHDGFPLIMSGSYDVWSVGIVN